MDVANIVLEYFKVFLSTPVVVGVIALVGLILFKSETKALIDRIASVSFPGGGGFSTSQQSRAEQENVQGPTPDVPEGEEVSLPEDLKLDQQQLEAVTKLYLSERANAYLWEYRYLNYFLAQSTQFVLDWLRNYNQPVSRSLFDNIWTPLIPSVEERQAILNALQAHYLIQMSAEGLVEVTPKGHEYVEWRGPLPPPRQIKK